MKLGLIGPAGDDEKLLNTAIRLLVKEVQVEQVIYLGSDALVDDIVLKWAEELMKGKPGEQAFMDRALRLARSGSAEQIDGLLKSDEAVRKLGCVRKLPPAPARAIEMIGDRIVTVVHDKATLDEEDIANASLLVYGKSDEMLLKKFGHRYFFTPGPLASDRVAVIEIRDGDVSLRMLDTRGKEISRETLQSGPGTKVTVSS